MSHTFDILKEHSGLCLLPRYCSPSWYVAMRLNHLAFAVMAFLLATDTVLSVGADDVSSADNKEALTGRITQNRLSENKQPLTSKISQSFNRLFGTRGSVNTDTMPSSAPSFRNPLAADSGPPVARGNYGGIVNVSQFSTQTQKTQSAAQARKTQFAAHVQRSQFSAHAQKAQASAQAQNAYFNNRAARRAEMEAMSVGLSAAGLGAWHCPVCRLLKGF